VEVASSGDRIASAQAALIEWSKWNVISIELAAAPALFDHLQLPIDFLYRLRVETLACGSKPLATTFLLRVLTCRGISRKYVATWRGEAFYS
jgi:hypothetical protein